MAETEDKCSSYHALGRTIGDAQPITPRRLTMLSSVIRFSTRYPKRVIALWAVVSIALAAVTASFGYKVVTDDVGHFLPKGSESSQAADYAETAFGQQQGTRTVTVLVKRADGSRLTAADRAEVR
jgi:uncharacterized membrane protein YdfJ with MMPL/SSD domain